jgi:multidrug efflux system outer membrane protein
MKARTVGWACAAALTTLTVGCSLAPEYQRPALPVANEYPADAPVPPGARPEAAPEPRGAAEIAWREYFTDPELQGMIAQALEHNRDLRVAALRVLEARAAFQIRRADQFPTVNLNAGELRLGIPESLSPTGSANTASIYAVGASVFGWELDFWGRVRNLKESALEQFLASDSARRAFTVSLVAQVSDGYLTLRELDERIRITRDTIRTREESLRLVRRRFQVGTATRLDVAQVETLLTQAQTLNAQLEQARAAQAHALTLLVGTPPARIADRESLNDAALVRDPPVGLPSDLLQQRPDIVAAEHRLKAANANIGAARAAFFPTITLTGFAGTASLGLGSLFESGTGAWLFLPQLVMPIFDAGRRQSNLDLAEVRRDAAVAEYERTIQAAFRDVADALSAQHWLGEQVAIQRRAVAEQTERARLATLRFDRGLASSLEVLDAQRDLLAAQQQLVQQRRALLSSRVALYAALGGGSQHYGEPPAPTARYERQETTR